jgi:uncharacterized repeat protein (TIGR03803 family)
MGNFARFALSIGAAAFFAGCGGLPQTQDPAQGSALRAAASAGEPSFRVLYDFKGHGDGEQPAILVEVGGLLYGAASAGPGSQNGGLVFVITPAGKERVLWHPTSGVTPGHLIALHRVLYGTAKGAIFSLTVTGVERTLYNLNLRKDEGVSSLLITSDRTFYGTAYSLSRHPSSDGSIFTVNYSGVERVLYSFPRDGSKGMYPSSLLRVNGTLYGTTLEGGANGGGTVFALSPSGALSVVHSFGAKNDGSGPSGGLTAVDGVLYGATGGGGSGYHCSFPTGPPSADACGTIYSLTLSGKERVLYDFENGADSANPSGRLIDVAGTLYGTAFGDPADYFYFVGGSVFSITPTGTFHVLHTFSIRNSEGGANPTSGLTELNGTLYGTTHDGGKYNRGTVFRLEP